MRVLRTVLQGFQNNMGWSVTELSSGDVAIFNGYNGVLYIVALQIAQLEPNWAARPRARRV